MCHSGWGAGAGEYHVPKTQCFHALYVACQTLEMIIGRLPLLLRSPCPMSQLRYSHHMSDLKIANLVPMSYVTTKIISCHMSDLKIANVVPLSFLFYVDLKK